VCVRARARVVCDYVTFPQVCKLQQIKHKNNLKFNLWDKKINFLCINYSSSIIRIFKVNVVGCVFSSLICVFCWQNNKCFHNSRSSISILLAFIWCWPNVLYHILGSLIIVVVAMITLSVCTMYKAFYLKYYFKCKK